MQPAIDWADLGSAELCRDPLTSHPYQVTLSGCPVAATVDLLPRLIDALSTDLYVGQASRATGPEASSLHRLHALLDFDAVLAEGPYDPDRPTVLLLNDDGRCGDALEPLDETALDHIIATVGPGSLARGLQVPHHHPSDVTGLARSIRMHLTSAADRRPLFGLVLTGGSSRRMGRAKWALEYHGAPHALYLQRLLESHCREAFLSISTEQVKDTALANRPHLVDRFHDMGPLGGILTAMTERPEAAWLVLACDLPHVGNRTIERLLAGRAALRFATSYRSPRSGLPEPLCTIYEPKARLRLLERLASGDVRLRPMLLNSRSLLLDGAEDDELTKVNDQVGFEGAAARAKRSN